MAYLPDGWSGKQVAVVLEKDGTRVVTTLVSDSAGGVIVKGEDLDNVARTSFIPWTSVQYVHLLEPHNPA